MSGWDDDLGGSRTGGRPEDDYWNDVFLEWLNITFLLKEMLKWFHFSKKIMYLQI